MRKQVGNDLQADSIHRYHQHRQRLGCACSLEESARQWITRYAACWRKHHQKSAKPFKSRPLKSASKI